MMRALQRMGLISTGKDLGAQAARALLQELERGLGPKYTAEQDRDDRAGHLVDRVVARNPWMGGLVKALNNGEKGTR